MEFYSAFGKRPVRLSDATRKFAYDSLHCRYGKETAATPTVSLDHVENFAALTEPEKYDLAIREICLHAPLRICEGEKLSGSATLGEAIRHHVPASFEGKTVFYAVSHLTTDFETVVRRGIGGIREDVLASLERHRGTDREPFLQSCLSCLDSFALWHGRYLEALREAGYEENYQVLSKVCPQPFGRPCRAFGLLSPSSGFAATGPASAGSTGCWETFWTVTWRKAGSPWRKRGSFLPTSSSRAVNGSAGAITEAGTPSITKTW